MNTNELEQRVTDIVTLSPGLTGAQIAARVQCAGIVKTLTVYRAIGRLTEAGVITAVNIRSNVNVRTYEPMVVRS